ncbi:phasin family protein [Azospirillum halopraeferens]|uniref:phasin family protein n=1 Tax=Azospirillum halopraeferens TaxID=34010 RepID=UPI0003F729EE|nr:phasin family protein [Azospirillum halopraeferens]
MTTTVKGKPAIRTIEDVATRAKENFEGIVKAQQEQAQKQFEQTMSAAKEQVEKASGQLLKGYEDLTAFNKDNVEALLRSGSIVAKGAEDLGKEVVAFAQASFDKQVEAGKAALQARSVRELVDLQNDYFKASVDAFVAESTKLHEMSVQVANAAFAPLSARMNAAVETFSKPLAA